MYPAIKTGSCCVFVRFTGWKGCHQDSESAPNAALQCRQPKLCRDCGVGSLNCNLMLCSVGVRSWKHVTGSRSVIQTNRKVEPGTTSVPRKSAAIAVPRGGLIENEWEIRVFTAVPDLVRAETRSLSQNIRTVLLCSVGFMCYTRLKRKKPRGNFLKGELLSKKKKKKNVIGNWMNLTCHIKPDCFSAVWVELITARGSLLVWRLTLDARHR